MQRAHKGSKRLLLFQCFECTGQAQPFLAPELLESLGKLAAKHFAQHAHGQKEVRLRVDPTFAIRRKTARGNHPM
jgi:hypothetical protein